RIERESLRQMRDLLEAVEDQVFRVGVLTQLSVHPALDVEGMRIANLVRRHDPRADGTMRVERLAHLPGIGAQLPVAHTDIVADEIAGNHLMRTIRRHMLAALADDETHL